jgi:hypothetical protein
MEGQEMAYAKLRECSGGQPKYRVEIYYDGQGVCYFRDGWSKFFIDYGVHEGWFLLLTRHDGKKDPLRPYLRRLVMKGGLRRHPMRASLGRSPCGARARLRKASIPRARSVRYS